MERREVNASSALSKQKGRGGRGGRRKGRGEREDTTDSRPTARDAGASRKAHARVSCPQRWQRRCRVVSPGEASRRQPPTTTASSGYSRNRQPSPTHAGGKPARVTRLAGRPPAPAPLRRSPHGDVQQHTSSNNVRDGHLWVHGKGSRGRNAGVGQTPPHRATARSDQGARSRSRWSPRRQGRHAARFVSWRRGRRQDTARAAGTRPNSDLSRATVIGCPGTYSALPVFRPRPLPLLPISPPLS